MSVPDIIQPRLNGEQVAAHVSLSGEDMLFVTATRTLIYRGEGLLSDESVEEYAHDAERIAVSEGRRKSKIELDYGIDGEESFTIPGRRVDDALHPVLAGVLNAAGVTDPGESITETYRFSELTLVITSARIIKHIGEAVWDQEFEEYHYDDIRDIEVEEGSVSSQIVIDVAGRPQRIKAQNDVSRDIYERIKRALLAYHDFDSYAEFRAAFAPDESESEDDSSSGVEFDENIEPIEANLPDDEDAEDEAEADAESESEQEVKSEAQARISFDESEFESAASNLAPDEDSIAELVEAVERQNDLIAEQQRVIEQLVAELNRDQ